MGPAALWVFCNALVCFLVMAFLTGSFLRDSGRNRSCLGLPLLSFLQKRCWILNETFWGRVLDGPLPVRGVRGGGCGVGRPGCIHTQLAEVLCWPELCKGFICSFWHSLHDCGSLYIFITRVKPLFSVL